MSLRETHIPVNISFEMGHGGLKSPPVFVYHSNLQFFNKAWNKKKIEYFQVVTCIEKSIGGKK
jgi:hypothetical protein